MRPPSRRAARPAHDASRHPQPAAEAPPHSRSQVLEASREPLARCRDTRTRVVEIEDRHLETAGRQRASQASRAEPDDVKRSERGAQVDRPVASTQSLVEVPEAAEERALVGDVDEDEALGTEASLDAVE